MVLWGPAARTAFKVAPIALEVARQLDRQIRPHVLAYRLARDVDGYVGHWSTTAGGHWVVLARTDGEVLRSFPPLPSDELALLERELDRGALRHHQDLPEARIRDTATRLRPPLLARRPRAQDREYYDVEVIDVDREPPDA